MSSTKTTSTKPELANGTDGATDITIGIADEIGFLDSLLRMGEEPYEIEYSVSLAAENLAKAYISHAGIPAQSQPYTTELINSFFEQVYIINWGRRASIGNISERNIKEFVGAIIMPGIPTHEITWMVCHTFIKLYSFLEAVGYPAKYKTIQRTLRQISNRALRAGIAAAREQGNEKFEFH